MRVNPNSTTTTTTPETRVLRQLLLGLAFLGAIAVLSLPGARGTGAVGWMPLWLLGMPLAGLLALALADLRGRWPARRAAAPPLAAARRRRSRPAQARRRPAARPGMPRRRPQSPAAA